MSVLLSVAGALADGCRALFLSDLGWKRAERTDDVSGKTRGGQDVLKHTASTSSDCRSRVKVEDYGAKAITVK